MIKPLVAVVGRPNVGKSTLFNRLTGKRIAIVEDTPGVTRDRIYADAEWQTHSFTLIDTGGIEPFTEDVILSQMRTQAMLAMDTADVIVFVVDGRGGLHSADAEVATMLRRTKKPVVLAVNKLDTIKDDPARFDFYSLGLGEPMGISAEQALGLGDLLDEIVKHFPEPQETDEADSVVRFAVVGRPNVGKSSLVNAILREERSLVSDIAGTTRDAVDTPLTRGHSSYIIIDTAGIRRKRSIEKESIERYSVIRAFTAIRRSDVVLHVIDGVDGLSEQDTKIAGFAEQEGKACVVCVNKWDLVEKDTHTLAQMQKKLRQALLFLPDVPVLFLSAKTGQRVDKILDMVDTVYEHASLRVTTGTLNDVLGEALSVNEPPSQNGRRLNIYYITQVSVRPPTFVLFVNDPALMHFSYQRYLENALRKAFPFQGTPIRLIIRAKKDDQSHN